IRSHLDIGPMTRAAGRSPGRHGFTAFTDKRLAGEDSRIVVVDSCDVATDGDLILLCIPTSLLLWKMVRKLIAFLAEVGRGAIAPDALSSMLHEDAEHFQPTAPPS